MLIGTGEFLILIACFFVVATLYSSVGFGGGSSYLAFLALFVASFYVIRSIALVCNLMVVSGSCYLYYKRGLLDIRKFLPFIVTSIPLAYVGATLRLEENTFFTILGATLIISAVALVLQTLYLKDDTGIKKYPPAFSYVLGGGVGFLAGLVGIGGGIFLAPILNHMRWDRSLPIAALTSFFILVNSISGISGLLVAGTFRVPVLEASGLLVAVLAGGQLGTRLSLNMLSGAGIKRITALLVFVVGVRVLLVDGLQIHFLP